MTHAPAQSLLQSGHWPPALGVHGGPDAWGVPTHDFSTNSNACGPCPIALAAVQSCDASRYPDPAYADLRQQLAAFHGVPTWRIVLAASASEFIYRITAWAAQQGGRTVRVPQYAYGDYAQAARVWGMGVCMEGGAALQWHADPSSPLGQSLAEDAVLGDAPVQVLDCAYEPLRLSGTSRWTQAQRDALWQLYSPNKALGMTGVRAAFAIAPTDAQQAAAQLGALAPSWVLGAHGVALLDAWVRPAAQGWLRDSLHTLRRWKASQIEMLVALGWVSLPSEANFFCAQAPGWRAGSAPARARWGAELQRLRATGIKLRDAASFGLDGHARLGVLSPRAQDALEAALRVA